MAFLTLAGITGKIIDISEGNPLFIGDQDRAANGDTIIDVVAEKRNWDATFLVTSLADKDALWAAVDMRAPVTLTGDFIGGASVTVIVTSRTAQFIRKTTGFDYEVHMTVEEA